MISSMNLSWILSAARQEADDVKKRAMDFCRGKTDQTCALYVVDDEVVAGR